MKSKRVFMGIFIATALLIGISVYAQVNRPFKDGAVWNLAMIRAKPGMENAYKNYLAGQWKAQQEALKKNGMILDYMVLESAGHSPNEWNLLLMTKYKDLATMEANVEKTDAMAQQLIGDDEKQMEGYRKRAEIREVLGGRLAREIVFK